VLGLFQRRVFACIVLVGVLAVYSFMLVRLHPTNFFGLTQDDTIYFSSAKALAEGRGYILPSLPGTPAQRKYPVLYPWLLSWVWRWNPSFPANVRNAVGLTAVFGAAFILLIYLFLHRLKGLSEVEALLLTAFCAWGPHVLFYSGSVLSDIPFACLTLAAVLVGDAGMRQNGRVACAVASGLLAGATMLLRVLGIPVAAGIVVVGAIRGARRQLAAYCATLAPFFIALAWNATFSMSAAAPGAGVQSNRGWQLAWAYYTTYLGFWKMSVANSHIFWAMLKSNANSLLLLPASFFLNPLVGTNTIWGLALSLVVSVGIVRGIVRQTRRQEWKPIHWTLPFYLVSMLVWNYLLADRLLLPFLPLMVAGLWLEGKQAFEMVRAGLARGKKMPESIVAGALGISFVALAWAIAWNYSVRARSIIEARSDQQGALLHEKREAYDWLRRHAPADARVVADEDASLYLYTGRQAVQAVVPSPAGIFEPARLDAELAGICETGQAIGAQYWMISEDDFAMRWEEAISKARAREREVEQVLPLVFRSRLGHVRVYSLGCVNHPEDPACQPADRVLFPSGSRDTSKERQ